MKFSTSQVDAPLGVSPQRPHSHSHQDVAAFAVLLWGRGRSVLWQTHLRQATCGRVMRADPVRLCGNVQVKWRQFWL